MKRFLALLLAFMLLTGCAAKPQPEPLDAATESAATDPSSEPADTGLYDPDSFLEAQTNGAVRAYPLEASDCIGIASMGEGVLLFSGGDETTLTLLSGDNCVPVHTVTLDCAISPTEGSVQVTEQGMGYYDEAARSVVFLDAELRETERVELPGDIQGMPLLTPSLDVIYYCTASEIRALDLHTGISRLLKEQSYQGQTLTQCCFDGEILACAITDADESCRIAYISAQTGETLGADADLENMATYRDSYFVQRTDGTVQEYLFGTLEQTIQSLNPARDDAAVLPALELGGALTCGTDEAGSLELTVYNFSTGYRVASVQLEGVSAPYSILADGVNKCIWFLTHDETAGTDILCRWDFWKSPLEDDRVYTGPRYTEEMPDQEGLAECQAWADRLNETYGVDIRIYEDAAKEPCGSELTVEFQTAAYKRDLAVLELAMSRFPKDFFRDAVEGTDSGVLHICLVRDISGDMTGTQYWGDSGDAFLAVEMGSDFERTFYHELYYVLDSHIIGNSLAFDTWNDLNPDGFAYDLDYAQNALREDTHYTEGENRAFIDIYSMSFPTEDRARIMEFAMIDQGADCFASEIMQNKLRRLCIGIREAFDLEKDSTVFPWEQYLNEPLAYQEES